jgi:hypothetical protein
MNFLPSMPLDVSSGKLWFPQILEYEVSFGSPQTAQNRFVVAIATFSPLQIIKEEKEVKDISRFP